MLVQLQVLNGVWRRSSGYRLDPSYLRKAVSDTAAPVLNVQGRTSHASRLSYCFTSQAGEIRYPFQRLAAGSNPHNRNTSSCHQIVVDGVLPLVFL